MMFQYFALLDRFGSDVNELDLSYGDRTLKIRKMPRKTLEDCLLPSKNISSSHKEMLGVAVALGEEKFWIDYNYELEDFKESKKSANDAVSEEMEKMLLALRLFKEGYIQIGFTFWRVSNGLGRFSSFVNMFRSDERPYFLKASELPALKDFQEELGDAISDEKRTTTKTALNIALRRFTDGYNRSNLEDRIIDYMIELEALYLQEKVLK